MPKQTTTECLENAAALTSSVLPVCLALGVSPAELVVGMLYVASAAVYGMEHGADTLREASHIQDTVDQLPYDLLLVITKAFGMTAVPQALEGLFEEVGNA